MTRVGLVCPSIRVEDAYRQSAEHLFRASGENTGNFAFVQALHEHLSPHVVHFPWFAPVERVRERCDVLVMACANQLGDHSEMGRLGEWFEEAGLPVVAIGLGAQAQHRNRDVKLHEGTLRWLKVIASLSPTRAPNIGVRGEYTLQQLDRLGVADRALITGCPSNFLTPSASLADDIASFVPRSGRIAVAAGFYKWDYLQELEHALARLVAETDGLYVVQSELEMLRIARSETHLIAPAEFAELHRYTRPDLTVDAFVRWCDRYAWSFTDATSWMDILRKFDFAVGARFHGVLLGMQAGVPGGVIAHDSRTAELCSTMCVPFRDYREVPLSISVESLPQLFPFDAPAYARTRLALWSRYVRILEAAGIAVAPKFKSAFAAAADASLERVAIR